MPRTPVYRTETISLKLTPTEFEAVEKLAANNECSKSEYLRKLIYDDIKKHEEEAK